MKSKDILPFLVLGALIAIGGYWIYLNTDIPIFDDGPVFIYAEQGSSPMIVGTWDLWGYEGAIDDDLSTCGAPLGGAALVFNWSVPNYDTGVLEFAVQNDFANQTQWVIAIPEDCLPIDGQMYIRFRDYNLDGWGRDVQNVYCCTNKLCEDGSDFYQLDSNTMIGFLCDAKLKYLVIE